MPLRKEIEFPLFRLGTYTDAFSGSKVVFDEALLRQLAKNSDFVLRTKVLQAPVGYDHPAAKGGAHGVLTGARYENGAVVVKGTDWSDELVADVKKSARLAYSGEFDTAFKYTDEGGKQVELGPTIIGMGVLGASRPAIKNLKPLSEFGFAEGVSAPDAYLMREHLRGMGVVADYCDGKRYFAEVENDTRRFFDEGQQEPTMTDEQIQAAIAAGIKAATAPMQTLIETQNATIKAFSEEQKTRGKIVAFCETVAKEKPLGKLALERLDEALSNPSYETIRTFVEALPAFVVPGGRADDKGKGKTDDKADDYDETDEPKALAALKPKHFAELENPEAQAKIDAGIRAFAEFKPDAFKGLENNPGAQMKRVQDHVTARDLGTN